MSDLERKPVVLSIGSNIGDRLSLLQSAVDLLAQDAGIEVLRVSSVYETDPVGGPEQDDYLNAALMIETALAPSELLAKTQGIELQLHRNRDVRWGPRTIDIDIIDFDSLTSDDPVVTLPHPRAAVRAFVLIPWEEVADNAALPDGRPVSTVLAGLPTTDREGVRMRGDLSLQVRGP